MPWYVFGMRSSLLLCALFWVSLVAGLGCQKEFTPAEVVQARKAFRHISAVGEAYDLGTRVIESPEDIPSLGLRTFSPILRDLETANIRFDKEALLVTCRKYKDVRPTFDTPTLKGGELTIRISGKREIPRGTLFMPSIIKHCFVLAVDTALVKTIRVEREESETISLALRGDPQH